MKIKKLIAAPMLAAALMLLASCGVREGFPGAPKETFEPSILIISEPITVEPEDFSDELIDRIVNPLSYLNDERMQFILNGSGVPEDLFPGEMLTQMCFGTMQEAIDFVGVGGIPDFSRLGLMESEDQDGVKSSTSVSADMLDGQVTDASITTEYTPDQDPASPYKDLPFATIGIAINSTAGRSTGDEVPYKFHFNKDWDYDSLEAVLRAKSGARCCEFISNENEIRHTADGSEVECKNIWCVLTSGSFDYSISVWCPIDHFDEAEALIAAWLGLL